MSHGYSVRLAEAIKGADVNKLGVRLGRACLRHDVSVSEVAAALKVSRQTVYHWFCGLREPHRAKYDDIRSYIAALS